MRHELSYSKSLISLWLLDLPNHRFAYSLTRNFQFSSVQFGRFVQALRADEELSRRGVWDSDIYDRLRRFICLSSDQFNGRLWTCSLRQQDRGGFNIERNPVAAAANPSNTDCSSLAA